MKIIIDLSGKKTVQAVINTIQKPLNIHISQQPNFAGFNDDLRDIAQNSNTWLEAARNAKDIKDLFYNDYDKWWQEIISRTPDLATCHLVLNNIQEFKKNESEHYRILVEILEQKKDPKHRYDKVIFSYEIHDGENTN